MSSPPSRKGLFALSDVMGWDVSTLQRHFVDLLPGLKPPATKDTLLQRVLTENVSRKRLKEAIAAYDEIPTSAAVQGSAAPSPVSDPRNTSIRVTSAFSQSTDSLQMQINKLQSELAAVTANYKTLLSSMETTQKLLQDLLNSKVTETHHDTESTERLSRRNNLRITKLPEGSDPMVDVQHLFQSMGCQVKVSDVRRIGRAPISYAAKVAGDVSVETDKPRPVIVTFSSFPDKLSILRSRRNLKETEFCKVGINDDLTPMQVTIKNAAWPAFIEAKKGNKRVTWRGHELIIDGQFHTIPPVADK